MLAGMLGEPPLDDLTSAERRLVRRALGRGAQLSDPRLVEALGRLARWHLAHSVRASLRPLLIALPFGLVGGLAVGAWLGADPVVIAVAVLVGATLAELLVTRPVRMRQAREALERHALD